MKRTRRWVVMSLCAAGLFGPRALSAQTPPEVTLTRLACGTSAEPFNPNLRFSDTFAYNGLKIQITYSCYLIKHGDDYLVWDTGNPVGTTATAPKTSLVDLLAQVGLKPEQI